MTLKEYHARDSSLAVESVRFNAVDISIVRERANDVTFTRLERHAIVVDLAGSKQHLTQLDGTTDDRPTRPGDVMLVPAHSAIRLAWDPLSDWQACISIEFGADLFQTYAPEMVTDIFESGHLMPQHYAPNTSLNAISNLLAREIDPDTRRGKLFAESAIRMLAFEIGATVWSQKSCRRQTRIHSDRRIGKAIDYIAANVTDDISLLDISRAAGLSPTHLTALFQRETGRTPYSYVIDQRLDFAVQLLRTTDSPMVQVALAAGFADQQHMTRLFRARLGRTPKQLRAA